MNTPCLTKIGSTDLGFLITAFLLGEASLLNAAVRGNPVDGYTFGVYLLPLTIFVLNPISFRFLHRIRTRSADGWIISFLYLTGIAVAVGVSIEPQAKASVNFDFARLNIVVMLLSSTFFVWRYAFYLYLFCSAALMTAFPGNSVNEVFVWVYALLFVVAVKYHHDRDHGTSVTDDYWWLPSLSTATLLIGGCTGLLIWMHITTPASQTMSSLSSRILHEFTRERISAHRGLVVAAPKDAANGVTDVRSKDLGIFGVDPQISFSTDLRFGDQNPKTAKKQMVFSVKLEAGHQRPMVENGINWLWKVRSLDFYSPDEGVWTRSSSESRRLESGDGKYMWIQPSPATTDYIQVTQHYEIRPQRNPYLVYLERPITLKSPSVSVDEFGNLLTIDSAIEQSPLKYSLVSSILLDTNRLDWEFAMSDPEYLAVPPRLDEYRSMALSIIDINASPFVIVRAIADYLQDNYIYDLSPGLTNDHDATSQFLFDVRRGYCQHFASAMALLLRSLAIPARIAVGFKGGTWNGRDAIYRIYNLDAHAWVEVEFADIGWYAFDPVPPAPRLIAADSGDSDRHARENGITGYRSGSTPITDSVETEVSESSNRPEDYDAEVDVRRVGDTPSSTGIGLDTVDGVGGTLSETVNILKVIVINILSVVIVFYFVSRYVVKINSKSSMDDSAEIRSVDRSITNTNGSAESAEADVDPNNNQTSRRPSDDAARRKVVTSYINFMKSMKYHRLEKPAPLTPDEYAQILTDQIKPDHMAVRRLTEIFQRARYSRMHIQDDDVRDFSRCVQAINDSVRSARPLG